jgi:hypothetical protein
MAFNISLSEQNDLLESVAKYTETYHTNTIEDETKTNVTIFSSDVFLFQLSDLLNNKCKEHQLYACLTEPMCICADADTCDCDHDNAILIENVQFDLGSNCSFILTFNLQKPLNQITDKKLKQELEQLNIRIFELDSSTSPAQEHSLIYIDRTSSDIDLSFPTKERLHFDIQDDKVSTMYKSIPIRINYMEYQFHDDYIQNGAKDKYSM